ncbi:BrnA antitoxin family protein [Brevundimonas faecalis]|uniref:BrnA antitoxin family protein n=1 Tax=Brevundimonas faecalis TaxID=947378 RepID=UPI00361E63EF
MKKHDEDDAPEFTAEVMARAKPAAEVLPPEVMAAFKKKAGRPRAEVAKVPVSLRLDPDVLDAFKATGAGWQTRINDALRKLVDQKRIA